MSKDLTKKQLFKNISALWRNARNKVVVNQKKQILLDPFIILLSTILLIF